MVPLVIDLFAVKNKVNVDLYALKAGKRLFKTHLASAKWRGCIKREAASAAQYSLKKLDL